MSDFHLRKSWPPKQEIDDDGSILQRWSATWEVVEYPGLFLGKSKSSDAKHAAWSFWCRGGYSSDEQVLAEIKQALALFPHLEGQAFATRREALQALEMVLITTGDSE